MSEKTVVNERLEAAVADVLRGRIKLPPVALNDAKGSGRIARLRERHHTIARLVAQDMPDEQVCDIMGMTQQSLDMLKDHTPAFQELVYHYRQKGPRAEREEHYLEQKHRIAKMAQHELHDRLAEDPDQFSPSELLRIQDSYDDRTGYSKQTVHVNVSEELGARLEARRRRKVPAGAGDGGEMLSHAHIGSVSPQLLELSAEVPSLPQPEPEVKRPQIAAPPALSVDPELHRQLSVGRVGRAFPDVPKGFKRRI